MAGSVLKNMEPVWEKSRGHYHYPALAKPRAIEIPNGGAAYNFQTRETLVDEGFVKKTSEASGLTPDQVLEGIFVHEIGHYMVYPRTLGMLILGAKMANDFFGKEGEESVSFIIQTYMDMCTDTASMLEEQKTGPILDVRCGFQKLKEDKLNHNVREVMLAYLHHQAKREFALNEELKPFFEKMLTIDFLD
ncbi:MAG: hypothetical protein PHF60_03750, partial [Candidatus ainarchaeum sp.]|nr:hypothetical protein [Candidatus ainarchaeum sp.]